MILENIINWNKRSRIHPSANFSRKYEYIQNTLNTILQFEEAAALTTHNMIILWKSWETFWIFTFITVYCVCIPLIFYIWSTQWGGKNWSSGKLCTTDNMFLLVIIKYGHKSWVFSGRKYVISIPTNLITYKIWRWLDNYVFSMPTWWGNKECIVLVVFPE